MRFVLLDFVRVLAISMILFVHVVHRLGSPLSSFFGLPRFYYVSLGGIGVTIFLILSGLVLEINQSDRKKISYGNFVLKRVLRIYPIYYMSLAIGIGVYIASQIIKGKLFNSIISEFNFTDLALSITGFYAFGEEWGGPFVPGSWFIGLIMVMYLFYPFISNNIRKNPNISIILLLIVSVVFRLIIGRSGFFSERALDWFPLCRIFEFSLGVYLARILPINTWQVLNSTSLKSSLVTFLSEISFPLFLVHTIFSRPILNKMVERNIFSLEISILIFLFVSIILSWLLLKLDKKIPRKSIFARFQ